MGPREANILALVRAACRAALASVADPAEKRRLEMASQVLTRLIVEARDLPAVCDRVAAEYGPLLDRLGIGRVGTRAPAADVRPAVQRALADGRLDAADAPGLARVVAAERDYFRSYEAATAREVAALQAAGAEAAGPGAALDPVALGAFLGEVFGAPVAVESIGPLALGYSKVTLALEVRGPATVPPSLIVRMDRPFNYLGTTVVDEFPILQAVYRRGVRVPRPYALESTGRVLGQPFLVVDRAHGRNVGSHFIAPKPDPALCTVMAEQLAAIHAIPAGELPAGLAGRAETPEAQLAAEIDKYHRDWAALGVVSPVMEAAFRWVMRNRERGLGDRTLVHGDYSLSNLLVDDQGRIAAVLDWEFARFAPAASDLGWFHYMADRLGGWQRFLDAYRAAGGTLPDERQLDFYVLWGALKLAVMNYQVDHGVESGQSSDLKHAYAGATFTREVTLRVVERLDAVL